MWQDVLTIIGFILTVITFFGITPREIYKVSKNQKILKFEKFDILLGVMTVFAVGMICYYKITHTGSVWNYVHLIYLSIYPWVIKLGFAVFVEHKNKKLLIGFIIISSIVLQAYSIPSINLVINSVHDSGYLLKSWLILGFVIFGWLVAGINIGISIFFAYSIDRVLDMVKNLRKKHNS